MNEAEIREKSLMLQEWQFKAQLVAISLSVILLIMLSRKKVV